MNPIKSSSHRFFILISLFVFLFFSQYIGYSQGDPLNIARMTMPTVTPLTPDVTSMGRYTMTPPSYSNGLPQQTIPLMEIKENDLSYPLSLYYNYSGFKLKEEASTVGLGWGLSEGMIIRIVKHVNDEHYSLVKKYEDILNDLSTDTRVGDCGGAGVDCEDNAGTYFQTFIEKQYSHTFNRMFYKLYDAQPDLYIYNFNGYSGKFIWINDHAILLEHSDVLIEKVQENPEIPMYFKITTPDGIQYKFKEADRSIPSATNSTTALGCGMTTITTNTDYAYATTWKLAEMKSNVTNAKIYFTYSENYTSDVKDINQVSSVTLIAPQTPLSTGAEYVVTNYNLDESYVQTIVQSSYLKEITSDHYKISFITKPRSDGAQSRIDEIQLYSKLNLTAPVKTVKFTHEYFGNESNPKQCWLKLNKVNIDGLGSNDEYKFSYVDENASRPLISKQDLSIDHWGYYNGAINSSLIPISIKPSVDSRALMAINVPYGNREPSFNHAKAFALETVQYPTKGYTRFNYEWAGVGIRVASLQDYDMGKSTYRYFDYHSTPSVLPAVYYEPSEYYSQQCCQERFIDQPRGNFRYTTYSGYAVGSRDFIQNSSNSYENVTEYLGTPDGKGGRNEYTYTHIYGYNHDKSFLTEKTNYEYGKTSFVNKEQYLYNITPLQNLPYWGIPKLQVTYVLNTDNCHDKPNCCPKDDISGYSYNLSDFESNVPGSVDALWFHLDKTITTLDGVSSIKDFTYDVSASGVPNRIDPISISETAADGKTKKIQLYYAGDVDPDNASARLGNPVMWDALSLNYKHYRNPLIKMRVLKGNVLISKEVAYYSFDPLQDLTLKTGYDVMPGGVEANKSSWTFSYDDKANMVGAKKSNDIGSSYFWGYDQSRPIVKAYNVSPEDLKIAVLASTNNIEQLLIDVGDLTTDGQRQLWRTFNTQLKANLPINARVTTYTFRLLGGLTSQTDPNGKVAYFSYDQFGRLQLVKDDKGNIVKGYSYTHK